MEVGRAAAAHGVVLVDLRPADGGLEEMFLELTASAQREGNVRRDEEATA